MPLSPKPVKRRRYFGRKSLSAGGAKAAAAAVSAVASGDGRSSPPLPPIASPGSAPLLWMEALRLQVTIYTRTHATIHAPC